MPISEEGICRISNLIILCWGHVPKTFWIDSGVRVESSLGLRVMGQFPIVNLNKREHGLYSWIAAWENHCKLREKRCKIHERGGTLPEAICCKQDIDDYNFVWKLYKVSVLVHFFYWSSYYFLIIMYNFGNTNTNFEVNIYGLILIICFHEKFVKI